MAPSNQVVFDGKYYVLAEQVVERRRSHVRADAQYSSNLRFLYNSYGLINQLGNLAIWLVSPNPPEHHCELHH